MTDWSNDPVFGDVALQVAARDVAGIVRREGAFRIACRTAGWSARDQRALRPFLDERPDKDSRTTLSVTRGELLSCGAERPLAACLLAAGERASEPASAPRFLGVVNVTPDSFSDGGEHLDPMRAIEHGLALVRDGAGALDVGGESTRPGAEAVDEAEELRRVFRVVCGLAERTNMTISVDTTKSRVAAECLAAGASIVNDVSAGRFDPEMLGVVARAGAGFVAMHMLGTPRDMQQAPRYANVVGEVTEFLRARCRAALEAGIERSRLWIDPGIGFGKTLEHNLELLRGLHQLRSLGLPVLVGVSRKAFVAAIEERAGLPRSEPHARLGGTLAALTVAVQNGAEILRVHDVREAKQAALVARALAPWNRDVGAT